MFRPLLRRVDAMGSREVSRLVRVGYFCLQSLWSIHFAHDLELIQADLDAGHDVHVVYPSKTLRYSDTSPFDFSPRQQRRELRCFWTGLNLLTRPPSVHTISSLIRFHRLYGQFRRLEMPPFESREALNDFRFNGHDAGNAVLSSVIWETKDTEVDLTEHANLVERALDTSIKVYIAARSFIERVEPDRVVLFNGRMATFRGVLRACQETGTPCLVHERGATLDRISLTENTMPHDPAWVAQQINETWNKAEHNDAEKRAIGRSFYERKRNGDGLNWISFTEGQEVGRLPFQRTDGRTVFSIFTSSEHERFALPQYYRYLLHESQLEGILDIIRILEAGEFPGLLCIRIHPNSAGGNPNLQEMLQHRVTQDFVRIAGARSPVDTYALIDASEKVFTFGSTVAMEAAYWGKPSISFATSRYDQLDSIIQPTDHAEAVRLVLDPVPPRDSEDTLKYGYYYSVFGRPLRYAEPIDLNTFRFKGKSLHRRRDAKRAWRRAQRRDFWQRLFTSGSSAARSST